jgi:hypothetical protein
VTRHDRKIQLGRDASRHYYSSIATQQVEPEMNKKPSSPTEAAIIVNAVSECGTYKEVLKCKTMEEAQGYKEALEADGWKVQIIDNRNA